MATGTYKPMIKVWELDQLAVKFERVTEAENVDFVVSRMFLIVLIWDLNDRC